MLTILNINIKIIEVNSMKNISIGKKLVLFKNSLYWRGTKYETALYHDI